MKKITDYARAEKAARAGNIAGKTLIYFFLLIWALIVLFPFYGAQLAEKLQCI